jgi:hypothetical protein
MEKGHNTFRGFVQQKSADIDKALSLNFLFVITIYSSEAQADVSDDNERQVFKIIQDLGKVYFITYLN